MNRMRYLMFSLICCGLGAGVAFGKVRTISVNFSGDNNGKPVSTGKYATSQIGYEGYAVPGSQWIDCTFSGNASENPETLVDLPIKDNTGDLELYKDVKVYLCSRGGFWQYNNPQDGNLQMLNTYLDDNGGGGSDKAGFRLTEYRVIVYFNRDTGGGIPAYRVNGLNYKGTADGTVLAGWNDTWGSPCGAGTLSEERNTLIVKNLTGPELVVRKSNNQQRGCISGFQIVGILPGEETNYSAELTGDAVWSTQAGISNPSGPLAE